MACSSSRSAPTGAFLGRVGPLQPPGWPGFEIGWALAPAARGKGYAAEAACAAIDWSFETFPLERIVSVIDPRNLASQRVAERLGERRTAERFAPFRDALRHLGDQPRGLARKEEAVTQSLAHIALVVRDYDEAIAWFTGTLGFTLVADDYQPEQDKRWVLVAPPGAPAGAASLLLARAATPEQAAFIGNQAGGRVFLFLADRRFRARP